MPMFTKDGVLGRNGRVLAVVSAVKDGVLGGGAVVGCVGVGEKMDLKKMIDELNLSEVPSVFICPISLEPMQDPVTLCTGQTYERSNILKWLKMGHYTCPTTMQELWDDTLTLTPNTTLHHLISTWFSHKYLQMKKTSQDAAGRASELLANLKKVKGHARIQTLKHLQMVVANHSTARTTVVEDDGVSLLSSLLGPFTSYAVGSEVVAILANLSLTSESKITLMQPAKVSSIVDAMNEGSIETKINCVKLIEMLMEEKDSRAELAWSRSLLVALMRVVRHPNGHARAAGLGLLKSISSLREVRGLIVSIGAIPQLLGLIPALNPECVEPALFILDVLSSVPQGRRALVDCSDTIPTMVKLLMRITECCTDYALSILCCVCKLSPQESPLVAVDAGIAPKLLLVIQSGCAPILKQRAAELLKLCTLNYSDSIFISKCKLTTTIQ